MGLGCQEINEQSLPILPNIITLMSTLFRVGYRLCICRQNTDNLSIIEYKIIFLLQWSYSWLAILQLLPQTADYIFLSFLIQSLATYLWLVSNWHYYYHFSLCSIRNEDMFYHTELYFHSFESVLLLWFNSMNWMK